MLKRATSTFVVFHIMMLFVFICLAQGQVIFFSNNAAFEILIT